MMITMRPGSATPAAGTATWASVLPIATAVPGFETRPRCRLLGQPTCLLPQFPDVA